MREFEKRKNARKIIYGTPVIVLLLIVVVFAARGALGVFIENRRSGDALILDQGRREELLRREEFLLKALKRYQSAAGVEAAIREKFGLAKEGERMIVVIQNTEDKPLLPPNPDNLWRRLLDFFRPGP